MHKFSFFGIGNTFIRTFLTIKIAKMKKPHRNLFISLIIASIAGITLYFGSCTNEDQDLDEFVPGSAQVNQTELIAKKVTTAPIIDGTIDASWDNAKLLSGKATVPDIPDNVFRGYVGNSYDFKIRSMYDAENIYFLFEWDDNTLSQNRETWYFDPATKRWKQENRYPTFNASGRQTRDGFYEDKLAFLWNINNSTANWNTTTCYATCHTGVNSNPSVRHYTNAASERIDMWHWKSVREGVWGVFDDQYQDNTTPNGRKSDSKTGGSYTDNIQSLVIPGTTDTVKVPKYAIPGRTNYYWITKAEIDNGTAKLITGVDANGVLSYSGGSIDPNTDVEYQRAGSTTGTKCIASIYTEKVTGNRGDITGLFQFTGSGWVMEISRKLKTADTENVDVDFSGLGDQYFGIGIFDNSAIAHAIKPNLVLKFEK
jgi:hypothetical protein